MLQKYEIILVVLAIIISTHSLGFAEDYYEISMDELYEKRIIDPKYLMKDNSYYLKIKEDGNLMLKYGIQNKPFLLDLNRQIIISKSESNWVNLLSGMLVSPYFNTDNFGHSDTFNQKQINYKGTHLISYNLSNNGKELFVYSFSGRITKPKGIGFWNTSSNQKIGFNYFEIWNLETNTKIYFSKKFSFRKGFNPYLLFWLNSQKILIFSNNYNRTLLVVKY